MLSEVTIPEPSVLRTCMAKVDEDTFAVFLGPGGLEKFYLFHLKDNTWERMENIEHGAEYAVCLGFTWENRNGTDDRVIVHATPGNKTRFFSMTVIAVLGLSFTTCNSLDISDTRMVSDPRCATLSALQNGQINNGDRISAYIVGI